MPGGGLSELPQVGGPGGGGPGGGGGGGLSELPEAGGPGGGGWRLSLPETSHSLTLSPLEVRDQKVTGEASFAQSDGVLRELEHRQESRRCPAKSAVILSRLCSRPIRDTSATCSDA